MELLTHVAYMDDVIPIGARKDQVQIMLSEFCEALAIYYERIRNRGLEQ